MTLLDTGALIDYLNDRGLAEEVERVLGSGDAAVASITVFELLAGVKSSEHLQERREILALTQVIPLSAEIAERAAALFTTLRASGTTVDNEDLIVAATGLTAGLKVLTSNARHFEKIPGLELQ